MCLHICEVFLGYYAPFAHGQSCQLIVHTDCCHKAQTWCLWTRVDSLTPTAGKPPLAPASCLQVQQRTCCRPSPFIILSFIYCMYSVPYACSIHYDVMDAWRNTYSTLWWSSLEIPRWQTESECVCRVSQNGDIPVNYDLPTHPHGQFE